MTHRLGEFRLDFPEMSDDPQLGAEELHVVLAAQAPEMGILPSKHLGQLAQALSLTVETAASDDPYVRATATTKAPAIFAALWCHTGIMCSAWDIFDLPRNAHLPSVHLSTMTVVGHWLFHVDWIADHSKAVWMAKPDDPPTFVATGQPPVTVFERRATSFASAFLMPRSQIAHMARVAGKSTRFGDLLVDASMIKRFAEFFEVPLWSVSYRLKDLADRMDKWSGQ